MPLNHHDMPSEAFFELLLNQQRPREPAYDCNACQARLLCGRWLMLRRIRLGLTCEALARQARLDPQSLAVIELGLADAALAPGSSAGCLCRALAGDLHDDAWIAVVLTIALGCVAAPNARIMRRVAADLAAAYDQI